MNPAAEEGERNESYRNVTEYLLMKLKRVDDEMNVTNAELREVMEETKIKDSRINYLKNKLRDLMAEESKKKVTTLESTKAGLDALVRKANHVLGGLGLIWVGDDTRKDQMACCTSTNENYKGLKRIPLLRRDTESIHQGHSQFNRLKDPVVPFSGVGYRLGTGSEIYGCESSSRQQTPPISKTQPSPSEKVIPAHRHYTRAKVMKNVRNIPVESVMDRLSSAKHKTDEKIEKIIEEQPKFRRTKSYEELPIEFLKMTTNERYRALKQMSIQIQKNMNKYYY